MARYEGYENEETFSLAQFLSNDRHLNDVLTNLAKLEMEKTTRHQAIKRVAIYIENINNIKLDKILTQLEYLKKADRDFSPFLEFWVGSVQEIGCLVNYKEVAETFFTDL